jgi:hypothetical protein
MSPVTLFGYSKRTCQPTFRLFFVCHFSSPLSPLFSLTHPHTSNSLLLILHIPPHFEMIMVQKPVHLLSPTTYHRRHPSAPPTVLVQPTRIPGLLSLSKPPSATPSRPQQHHNRHPRPSHNNKPKPASTARQSLPPTTAAQPQPLLPDDSHNLPFVTHLPIKPQPFPVTPSPAQDKSLRGRQSSKQSRDKPTLR